VSRSEKMRDTLLPWAGIAGAALGAGIAHQTGSDWIITDCPDSTPLAVVLACLLGSLIVAAGAFGSWIAYTRTAAEPARRLVAAVSLMLSALALFAILLPVVAALVIPTCFA
jgi:hypothetical protein